MRAEQQYIDLFSQCEAMICRHSAEVLNAPRAQAFADFEKLGFPTRKQEKYKYTDVSKLFEPDYGLNLNRLDIPVNPYEVFKCDVPNMSTALYFVVNDAFYRKALPKAQLPEGVLLGSLKELSEQYPALVKQYYGKLADTSKDGVTAFNTTFAQDGFMLYVPKGVVVDKPIQLVNILRADVNFMVNRRVLVVLEEGAQARLLICDHAMDNVNFLSTQVIEVFAKENATFDLYELEETHTSTVRFSNLYVNQEADSNVLLNGMTLHNGTTRNTTEVTLAGRGAEINLCGMVIADKNEQVDNHTFIDHKVADCTSNELFKYVLDDQATGAFAGKVLVREGAQHTNSQQTNRNLCATRDAHMYTQPQLEIYADDVKCSHGATVGQLDENALFYMQQKDSQLKESSDADDDYDDFHEDLDKSTEFSRNYVPLNTPVQTSAPKEETGTESTPASEEAAPASAEASDFTPLTDQATGLSGEEGETVEDVEEFFDEEDAEDEEPPVNEE